MNIVSVSVPSGYIIVGINTKDNTYCVFTHEGSDVPVRYATYAEVTKDVTSLRSVDRAQGYWPSTEIMSRSEYDSRLAKYKAALRAA